MSTRQRILVTGKHGFVGQHVMYWMGVLCHVPVDTLEDGPSALLAMQWKGLPNYQSEAHYENVDWQFRQIEAAVQAGVTNITVVGTCLETVDNPPHYAKAKLELFERVSALPCTLKWVRLWYLYGLGQPEYCLLPRLHAAIKRGDKTFSIIDGSRDFMDVREAARLICHVAEQTEVNGIIDVCTGMALPVYSFCRRHMKHDAIELVADYPMPDFEPVSFHGNPEKVLSIK